MRSLGRDLGQCELWRTPILASGGLPSLRSGQVSLDEAEHFLHNRDASVLRSDAVHPGFSVRLRLNLYQQGKRDGLQLSESAFTPSLGIMACTAMSRRRSPMGGQANFCINNWGDVRSLQGAHSPNFSPNMGRPLFDDSRVASS